MSGLTMTDMPMDMPMTDMPIPSTPIPEAPVSSVAPPPPVVSSPVVISSSARPSVAISSSAAVPSNATRPAGRPVPTDRCNPAVIPDIPPEVVNFTAGVPFCQWNYPEFLGVLTTRCCGGNDVQVWQNCTQYCKTDKNGTAWGDCLRSAVPTILPPYGYRCLKATASGAEKRILGWAGTLVIGLALFKAFA